MRKAKLSLWWSATALLWCWVEGRTAQENDGISRLGIASRPEVDTDYSRSGEQSNVQNLNAGEESSRLRRENTRTWRGVIALSSVCIRIQCMAAAFKKFKTVYSLS